MLVQELNALAHNGGGFLEYIWPKPEKGDQPKLSYAMLIPGTDMWIGTGVYLDNVSVEKQAITDDIDKLVSAYTWGIGGTVAGRIHPRGAARLPAARPLHRPAA